MVTLGIVVFFLLMFQWPHLQKQTVDSLPFTGAALVLSLIYVLVYGWLQKEARENFDNLKDLMKGVIECDVNDIQEAYRHFKSTPDIEVTHIKEELRDFQKVTVNYIYDGKITGEMEIRCRAFSPTYYAIEFLSQVEEARRPIEVLQVLNHLEYFFSMNNLFELTRGKGKVSYCNEKPPKEQKEIDPYMPETGDLVNAKDPKDMEMSAAKELYQNVSRGREIRTVRPGKKKPKQFEGIN